MLIDETGSLYGVRNLNFMPDGPDPVKKTERIILSALRET